MKKIVYKIIIFLFINFLILNVVIFYIQGNLNSSICSSPNNMDYDVVIMGTSHAQAFTTNASLVEKIISKKIGTLTNGSAGVVPEKIFLSCFFKANNKTKQLVYFIDPWIFYAKRWNEDNYILQQDAIDYKYLLSLIENHATGKVIFNYFRDKLTFESIFKKSIQISKDKTEKVIVKSDKTKPVEEISEERKKYLEVVGLKGRLGVLYLEGLNQDNFNKYSKVLEDIIKLAKKNNAQIILVIPPTNMGELPGRDQTVKLLKKLQIKYGSKYYDFSDVISDDSLYTEDNEHLNIKGVEYFTKKYFKTII